MKHLLIFSLFYCLITVYSQETNSVINEVDSQRTVVLRLEPQPKRSTFMNQPELPRDILQTLQQKQQQQQQKQQSLVPQFKQQVQRVNNF